MNHFVKVLASALNWLFFVFVFTASAQASNFQFSRYLEVGATGTDNAELQQTGGQSELVLNVKPSVELKFSGNRLGAIGVAEVEYFRFNDAEGEIIDPRLFGRVRGTLIDDLLFLDSTITYSKLSPDSSFLRLSQDGDPAMRLKHRLFIDKTLGEFADVYLAYGHSSFYPDVGQKAASRQDGMEFWLGRDPVYGGLIWSIGGNYNLDESSSNSFENSTVAATLGVALSETYLFSVTSGIEDRKYISGLQTANPVVTEDENSSLWDANISWSPSERTRLSVGYGERFFGKGPSMRFDHRTENSVIFARYTRGITRTAPGLNSISSFSNTSGDSNINDTDSIDLNSSIAPELDEPFIDNSFELSYKLSGRRSDVIVDAVYSVQDQLDGDEQITSWLGRLIFDRRLSERTLLRFQYEHQDSEAPERPTKNYSENRFGVKFIFNFDLIEASRNEEFSG